MSLPESILPHSRTRALSGSELPIHIANDCDMRPMVPGYKEPAPEMDDCADSRFGYGILSLQSATDPGAISEALYWIESAAKQGHPAAEELLRKMVAAA